MGTGCLGEGFLAGSEGHSQQPRWHGQRKGKLPSEMPEGSFSMELSITCSYPMNVKNKVQSIGNMGGSGQQALSHSIETRTWH